MILLGKDGRLSQCGIKNKSYKHGLSSIETKNRLDYINISKNEVIFNFSINFGEFIKILFLKCHSLFIETTNHPPELHIIH